MSSVVVPATSVWDVLALLQTAGIRQPAITGAEEGPRTFTWTPDLTATEQTTVDSVVAAARSATGLAPSDYAAVRTQMQTLRAIRQAGRNAYVNMAEADRNRVDYDAFVAVLEIMLKLFRDT